MVDPAAFAQRQMELSTEFAKYLIEHPEVDESLPDDSYIYFQIDSDAEFN